MAMAVAGARQWSCIVRDPVGQPVPAWHPSNGALWLVVRHGRQRGAEAASDLSPTTSTLCSQDAEEGTKDGDDEEVPPVSQRRERRRRGGVRLAAWAARGRARPACGCVGQRSRDGELGRLVVEGRLGQLGCLGCEASSSLFSFSVFLFFFSVLFFLLLCLNSNVIWNLNSELVYLIHWSFRYDAHNILLYILGTLFSYFV